MLNSTKEACQEIGFDVKWVLSNNVDRTYTAASLIDVIVLLVLIHTRADSSSQHRI